MNKLLTIVIPTKNRPKLLGRSLSYYEKINMPTELIIADSSDNLQAQETKKLCNIFSSKLNINYFHVSPDTEPSLKTFMAVDMVNTPYVLWVGDDDFLLASTIKDILSKMEGDKSIAGAFGNRVAITQVSQQKKGNKWIKSYPNYSGISITNYEPLDRIKRLPIPNWQQYQNSIFRTHVFRRASEIVSNLDHTQYSEFFLSSMILAHGSWIKYNQLFAVCHQESKFCKFKDRYLFPHYIGGKGSVLSGVSQTKWSQTVSLLCDIVGEEIGKIHSQNEKDISGTIRKIYYSKLIYYLEYNNNLSNNLIDSNSNILRTVNNIFRKLGKLYWILVLYNKSGGVNEYFKFTFGLVKEVMKGRIIKMLFKSETNVSIKSLLTSIKRVGSLDYESDSLLSNSSKYNKEYRIIFDIWKKNPCPQKIEKK